MDAILARLSQLEAEAREQKETIVQLTSENAGLASEVTKLRTTVSDQGRVIADLSLRAVPDGFWVWESNPTEAGNGQGRGEEDETGRWVWSSVSAPLHPNDRIVWL